MTEEETSALPPEEANESKGKSGTIPKLFLTAAIFVVFAVTILVLWGGRDELRKVKVGFPAPDFTFRDMSHKEVSLSDYQGKVVLLNLWSITCPPCIDEVPYLEGLYQKMKGNEDFHLLTVVTNRGETAKEVKPFLEKHGLNFHVLIDNKKVAWRRYKLTGWPETFLIGRDGIIVEKFIGPREWDSSRFISKIKSVIEEKK